jgi:hypothetical protein
MKAMKTRRNPWDRHSNWVPIGHPTVTGYGEDWRIWKWDRGKPSCAMRFDAFEVPNGFVFLEDLDDHYAGWVVRSTLCGGDQRVGRALRDTAWTLRDAIEALWRAESEGPNSPLWAPLPAPEDDGDVDTQSDKDRALARAFGAS